MTPPHLCGKTRLPFSCTTPPLKVGERSFWSSELTLEVGPPTFWAEWPSYLVHAPSQEVGKAAFEVGRGAWEVPLWRVEVGERGKIIGKWAYFFFPFGRTPWMASAVKGSSGQ